METRSAHGSETGTGRCGYNACMSESSGGTAGEGADRRRRAGERGASESIVVTVRLFGGLDERAACGEVAQVEASVGTVGDLVVGLGLSATAVGLILVNGLHADLSSRLRAGDEVALFPPIGGG